MSTINEILGQVGALLTDDHFVYSSGKHGDIYINKNDLFAYTHAIEQAGKLLAEKYQDLNIDTVAGPVMCGILPAHWTAYHLSRLQNKEVFGVFAERDTNNTFAFKRGYDRFITGKNVLLIDDISTSGATLKKTITTIQSNGGKIVAAAVIVDRNPQGVDSETLGVPFGALVSMEIPMYEEADCPLCKKNIPINTTVGHGQKYLERKKSLSATLQNA